MRILLCGSLAYDTIMVFPDHFKHHILAEHIHQLSVAFLVPDMRREVGGTAGNIAYNLKLLGEDPIIMATVGEDFDPYRTHLAHLGLNLQGIRVIPHSYTAQAFITTDLDDNQITAFHPGAMNHSHLNSIGELTGIQLGIVSPDGREGMMKHARDFHDAGIPFLLDPGQAIPLFSGVELLTLIDQSAWLAVNDYEAQLLSDKTGLSFEQLAQRVNGAVVTCGAEGSRLYSHAGIVKIAAVPASEVVDPTGCGDAYRAGLLYGLMHSWDWTRTGQLASLLGSIKISSRGGQNHTFDRTHINQRLMDLFGTGL